MMNPILVPTLDELAVVFDQAASLERKAAARVDVPGSSAADEAAYNVACNALIDVCSQIADIPAQTPAHIQLKARVLDWHAFPDGREPGFVDERLAFQLVRALLDGLPGDGR